MASPSWRKRTTAKTRAWGLSFRLFGWNLLTPSSRSSSFRVMRGGRVRSARVSSFCFSFNNSSRVSLSLSLGMTKLGKKAVLPDSFGELEVPNPDIGNLAVPNPPFLGTPRHPC
jgi:hypothetical protein